MPSGKNWIYFIYVNLIFVIYIAGIFYFSQMQEIQSNWQTYRCNPMYMPLADDINSNFTYCVQNSMSGFMGYILEPITFLTSSMSGMISGISDEVNVVRAMFSKVRSFISTIIQSVFGIFLNLIIEFQKIIISMKDLMGKTIGILVTFMYIMDGAIKTMQSAWNGPTGQLIRALGGCFDPDTTLRLKNGETVLIKNIKLGDVLENGSIVDKIIQIDNVRQPEVIYCIKGKGYDKSDIFVTGGHFIFDKNKDSFIPVSKYSDAIECDKTCTWLCNLSTSDNRIVIGTESFWDWDDDCLH
tara:strand:+ start:8908 stop:9801 length:894 start_codon:yes stop_codon:yes gene_type:complete